MTQKYYSVCVAYVAESIIPLSPSHAHTHTHTHTHTGGLSTGLIVGIVVVCVVVILLTFLAGCGVGVIVHVVYQKKSKQSTSMWWEYLWVDMCMCTSMHVEQKIQKVYVYT